MIKDQKLLAQLIVSVCVSLLLGLAAFVMSASNLVYFLIPLIIVNIVLIVVNKTKGLVINIALLALTPLMFVFLVEYLASIVGFILSLIYLLRFYLSSFRTKKRKK